MSDVSQPADLPLPENAQRWMALDLWMALAHDSLGFDAHCDALGLPEVWSELCDEVRDRAAAPALRAQGAAAEREAIQAHLRNIVADRARQGNDHVLGALLDAIRELVPAMPTTDDLLAGDAP